MRAASQVMVDSGDDSDRGGRPCDRGPGEFMGTRQSGLPDFRVASIIRDAKILGEAKRDAFGLIETDPALAGEGHVLLREVVKRRWRQRLEIAKTA